MHINEKMKSGIKIYKVASNQAIRQSNVVGNEAVVKKCYW